MEKKGHCSLSRSWVKFCGGEDHIGEVLSTCGTRDLGLTVRQTLRSLLQCERWR